MFFFQSVTKLLLTLIPNGLHKLVYTQHEVITVYQLCNGIIF